MGITGNGKMRDSLKKYRFVLPVVIVLIAACAAPVKKPVDKWGIAPPKDIAAAGKKDDIAKQIEEDERERKRLFSYAEDAFISENFDLATEMFSDFAARFPESEMADDAYFRLGEIYAKRGELEEAQKKFSKIVENYVGRDMFSEAKYRLARIYFKKGEYQDAIQTFKSLLDETVEKRRKLAITSSIADSYLNLDQHTNALNWYSAALEERPGEEDERKIKERLVSLITKKMGPEELHEATAYFRSGYIGDCVTYAVIERKVDEEKYEAAKKDIENYIDSVRFEDLKIKADELLQIIVQRMNVRADTIGCILPLSGRFAPYGQKVLKGVQLAAEIFGNSDGRPVNLIIKDSKGDPVEAVKAVEELADRDKVIAVVGPLLSKVAESAAIRAQEKGIPMIALSQKYGIPEIGNYVFRNFLTNELQTKSIAEYAIGELGIKHFAILYPKDVYGEELMNLFWNDVLLFGGEVVAIEGYDERQYDFGRELKRMVGMDNVDKKAEEKKEPWEKQRPIIDFEALFIADNYEKAASIAPQLLYNDITGVKLLGPNSWNSPKLVEIGGGYVEGAIFSEGFYSESQYETARNFVESFESAFGDKPGTLEAFSYDATKMIVDVIREGEGRSRVEMKNALLDLKDFTGATGRTSFTQSGDVNKSLFILTVAKGDIVEVVRPGWYEKKTESLEEETLSASDNI